MSGAQQIAAERLRQQRVEGYSLEHDAEHMDGSLLAAAGCYLTTTFRRDKPNRRLPPVAWPWAPRYWKPSPDDRVRELVKAGALIAAEIDRLQAVVAALEADQP